MLSVWRRGRVALWRAGLRARLRRQGVRLDMEVGPRLRLDGRPGLEIDPTAQGRGGVLRIRIGSDVRIGRDLLLDVRPGADATLDLGDACVLQRGVRLQLRGGEIRLAERVQGRDGCELKASGVLVVGAQVVLGRGTTLHCAEAIAVGDRAGFGDRVFVTDSDHVHDGSSTWFLEQPLRTAPVTVGANVQVGSHAVVLRGSDVGANAVVAAGALVAGLAVEPGWLAGGVPARPLRPLGVEGSGA